MGITMVRTFVRAGREAPPSKMYWITSIMSRAGGVEHVGIGSDVDLDGRDLATFVREEIRSGWRRLLPERSSTSPRA